MNEHFNMLLQLFKAVCMGGYFQYIYTFVDQSRFLKCGHQC